MDKIEIQKKIDRNRNEIQRFLSMDIPPVIMAFNIKNLSRQNERLLNQLNSK